MGRLSLLAEETIQSDWITTVFPILRYVLFGIVVLSAIVLIVAILLQSNTANDTGNVITGTQESYYSQNKGSTREGKLRLITIIMASVIAFCSLAYFITEIVNKTVA